MKLPFHHRSHAGRLLARHLQSYAGRDDLCILALPRGGVPVAFEVAKSLHAPLDVLVVRKLGVPGHEELAMGALASGGLVTLNDDVVTVLRLPPQLIGQAIDRERDERERRERAYRDDRPPIDVRQKVVILIDDGLATGATMRAAIGAVRQQHPRRIVVAVPVADEEVAAEFRHLADEVVVLATPEPFHAVGLWYRDFSQVPDAQVRDLLRRAAPLTAAADTCGHDAHRPP